MAMSYKKIIKQAVHEANLLQWVEFEMLKWFNDKGNVMDVAEKIIEYVRKDVGVSSKRVGKSTHKTE
jgi:hypothetical protein